ncbi:hypothetical protein TVAG_260610 [Trichomonas vaginalis G3]|uniref:Uncharacterized protein n=1 Tax=Trichomonas vaginalis (strain ATCC PRA-98 / G3) TaxID=412133 RepID=A2EXI4_TRIV3|nr:spectrin binding [Trichomonas vaginalis G3]EAY02601.1 hypothetical protein TVAG_260610 [Trichomonas vaginalis G3]KAI5553372.1 spectrin binding [Trichomonas vaginalis G3]|eukprot:XP_001314824.1 hypothetical protein [Trichomonas vaginalis G3]
MAESIITAADIEQKTIQIIQSGTLDDFKLLGIGSSDINRSLSISSSVKIVNKSKKYPFREITSPTIVVLAILCEREDILEYILDNLNPNLSIYVNGWHPIHYAACTSSYKCMQLLLKVQYIQENIDIPIIPSFKIETDPSYHTTALHIAVTNHRYAQVLLLTSPLPDIIYTDAGKKINNIEPSEFESANIFQLSLQGNSALHIATKIKDVDLVRILLIAGADPNMVNHNNITSTNLAKSLDYREIQEILKNNDIGEVDFYEKYFEPLDFHNMTKDNYDENSEENQGKPNNASKSEVEELQDELNKMIFQIQELSIMIHDFETKDQNVILHVCSRCGKLTENQCPSCSEYFCEDCFKLGVHSCKSSQ